eukprot:GHRQ01028920.1.p1 GENE.GHRQ01028920.1~~GHRQ01028920.1.p1  ORF type:complete len:128 (-),score=25.52 GHRQ01028920.1:128-511(-)
MTCCTARPARHRYVLASAARVTAPLCLSPARLHAVRGCPLQLSCMALVPACLSQTISYSLLLLVLHAVVACLSAGVQPAQVDILVTNCSIFSATPSLASMLINKFKFRTDVQSYHLVSSWRLLIYQW